MGDHREELLVRSRGTYLLIYNADRKESSACTSTNWKLAPFKFQTKSLVSWMSNRIKSMTGERRTQYLTGVTWHPQRKKSSYVLLAVRGKYILRVRRVRTLERTTEIGGRYLGTIVMVIVREHSDAVYKYQSASLSYKHHQRTEKRSYQHNKCYEEK